MARAPRSRGDLLAKGVQVLKAEAGATNKRDFYVRIFLLDFLCLIFLAAPQGSRLLLQGAGSR